MPSPSNTVITPSIKTECTTWSDAHIGIAPADGYLYVTGRTTNTDGFLQISSDTTEIAATTFGNTDKDIRLLFPFAKGQAMKVTAKSLKNIFLRFSSSIGGGYQALKNALLQGGVLCRLKHLYSSLRRSSLSVKRSGWWSSQPHPVLMFWLLRKRQMVDTEHLPSPHSTDFVLSDNTSGVRTLQILSAALRIKQTPLEWALWLTLTILLEGFTALFRSRKETKSKVESFKGRLTNSLSLRPQGKPSSAVGGASC